MNKTINSLIQLCDGKLLHGVANAIRTYDMLRKYRHRRCYACGAYGHIAALCNNGCTICMGKHATKDCMIPLIRSYHDLQEELRGFLKKTNMRTYQRLGETVERFDDEKYISYIESFKKEVMMKKEGYTGLQIQSQAAFTEASLGRTQRKLLKPLPKNDGATGRKQVKKKVEPVQQNVPLSVIPSTGKSSFGIHTMSELNSQQVAHRPLITKSRVVVPVLRAKPTGTITIHHNQLALQSGVPKTKPNVDGFLVNVECVEKNKKILRRTLKAIKRNGLKYDKVKMRLERVYHLKNQAIKTARAITTAAKLKAQKREYKVSQKLNVISQQLGERAQYNKSILEKKQALYNQMKSEKDAQKKTVDGLYRELDVVNKALNTLYAQLKENKTPLRRKDQFGNIVVYRKYDYDDLWNQIDNKKEERASVYAKINAYKQTIMGKMAVGHTDK